MLNLSAAYFNEKEGFTIIKADSNAALALVQMVANVLADQVLLLTLHTNHRQTDLVLFIRHLAQQYWSVEVFVIYQLASKAIVKPTEWLTRQQRLTTMMLNFHNCYLYFHFLHPHSSTLTAPEQATSRTI